MEKKNIYNENCNTNLDLIDGYTELDLEAKNFSNLTGKIFLNKSKDPEFSHRGFERIPVKELICFNSYLEYHINILELDPLSNVTRLKWLERSRLSIKSIMNSWNKDDFCTPSHVYNQIFYKPSKSFLKGDNTFYELGRLYGNNSIQRFPREVRAYLLSEEKYLDFDIVNAHLSILLSYARNNDIVAEELNNYVSNRDHYLQSLTTSSDDSTDFKTAVLMLINSTVKESNIHIKGRPNLKKLFDEIIVIRKTLWVAYSKTPGYEFYFRNTISSLSKQEVSLQAIFRQTQETLHVKAFINFLQKKFKEYVDNDKQKIGTYFPKNTSKKLKCNETDFLVTIPFFDGVLVYSFDEVFRSSLINITEQFNIDNDLFITFKNKSIETNYKNVDFPLLEQVTFAQTLTNSMSPRTWNIFCTHFNLDFVKKVERDDPNKNQLDSELANLARARKFEVLKTIIELDLPKNTSVTQLLALISEDKKLT
jgi:hypothetical protein